MKAFLFLCALLATSLPGMVIAEEAAGDWIGSMDSGFKVIVHIDKDAAGAYSGTLRTPNGNVTAFDTITSDGQRLRFAIARLELSYDGDWDSTGNIWAGKLTLGQTYPLAFRRATPEDLALKVRKRPQEDAINAGPRPYAERDVAIPSSGNISLAGTYSVPDGKGPFPAIVLVSGTGPNTRDEDVEGHKVFQVLSDALNRQGVAVLRYDKRGAGKSTGNYGMATTNDFTDDAEAVLNWLSQQPEVKVESIGIIGHSEGGIIAPAVAVRNAKTAYVAVIAGPGVRGDRLFLLQSPLVSASYGTPQDHITKRQAFDEKLYAAALSSPDPVVARTRVQAVVDQGLKDKVIDAGEAKSLPGSTTTPWMRQFLANDPANTLAKVRQPILVLNGSLDLQVPAKENLAAIRQALKNNPRADIRELPGLNHLLQTAKAGSPAEYGDIDETIAPSALEQITTWINRVAEQR
ncbi:MULTISPECIES: S9 family peptidase [Asticcacaulis]|uniref:alpha/beta hydrolase family protein n=1 Tax=Asticcacaulis TaxID=76890 RepID=UPI001AE8FA93|nr:MULTISPECIES: alpha/beta fold hydrolase [Asticcacaulis]MBP2160028.1 pimeloyl-ACP methyl ester carboxylesterase [Asticcacaulis solisilvae]MDR6801073.1 pimeloyl-ACP methyl ester carboxylesterase [Asticcacaulis sp. BE141]